MGSFVISGTAKALVIHTGANTEISKIYSIKLHTRHRISKRDKTTWLFSSRE